MGVAPPEAHSMQMVTAKLISAFVFVTRIVQSLYFLNLKFQASRHILWMYSPVCVRPGRKPQRPVLSQRDSYVADKAKVWCKMLVFLCVKVRMYIGMGITIFTIFILCVYRYIYVRKLCLTARLMRSVKQNF